MSTPVFPEFSELTFGVEGGNDKKVLKVHWPDTAASGVTLGAGYDMGGRTKAAVKADLIAAGVSADDADKLSDGAGKKGDAAKKWVEDNVATLPAITKDVAKKLYGHIYPKYVEKAQKLVKDFGGKWDACPTPMKEVLVDLGFRGDLVTKHEELVASIKASDYDAFCAVIHDLDYWQKNTNLPKQKPKNADGSFTKDQRGGYNWRIIGRSDFLTKAGAQPKPTEPATDDAEPQAKSPEPAPGPQLGLTGMSEEQLYEHLKHVWRRAQERFGTVGDATYDFQEENGRVNLLGARGLLPDKLTPCENRNTAWDDTMFVIYKDAKGARHVKTFYLSTEPNDLAALDHSSTLTFGMHRYWLGHHHTNSTYKHLDEYLKSFAGKDYKYRALKPHTSGVKTFLDKSHDQKQDGAEKEIADAAINIHYGGSKDAPTGWSHGCQVLRGPKGYRDFIELVESDASIIGSIDNELSPKPSANGKRFVIYLLVEGTFLSPPGVSFPVAGKDAEAHYALNEGGEGGFFPIGSNNFWHGGIHLDAGQDPIVAIADGEVVAYRINKRSIEVKLGGEPMRYSNSFVLIRHERYTPKGAKIELFSLAIHLLPFEEYTAEQKKSPPALFKKHTFAVDTSEDGKGLNVRSAASKDTVVGVIPRDAYFEVGSGNASWDKSKAYTLVTYGDISGYAYLSGGRAIKISGSKYQCNTAEDTPAAGKMGLNVREAGKGTRVVRVAAQGEKLTFKNPSAVAPGGNLSAGWHELAEGGWVYVRAGDKPNVKHEFKLEPDKFDQVVSCKIPVAGGAILGYPGAFFTRPTTVHFEVLTGDVGFMKNPKGDKGGPGVLQIAAGTKLKTRKTAKPAEIKVDLPAGAHLSLVDQPPGDLRKVSCDKGTGWTKRAALGDWSESKKRYTLKEPLAVLYKDKPEDGFTFEDGAGTVAEELFTDALPASNAQVCKDKEGNTWQEVESGSSKGWVQVEKDAKLLSAYDWPHWQRIEESGKFSEDGLCDAPALISLIDADGDGNVTSEEIKAALKKPAIAKKLRRLACQHPTEWAGDIEGLSRLSGSPWFFSDESIKATRDYIKKLGFWSDAAKAGLPSKDKVWHLHPIGLIEHLRSLALLLAPPAENKTATGDEHEGEEPADEGSQDKDDDKPEKFSELILLCEHEFDSRQRSVKDKDRLEVVQGSDKDNDKVTLLHRDSEKPSPDKIVVTCRGEKTEVKPAANENGYAQYDFDAPFRGVELSNIFDGSFWKSLVEPTTHVVQGFAKPITIASYRPDKWKFSLELPPMRGCKMGNKLETQTVVAVAPGAVGVAQRKTATLTREVTGWKKSTTTTTTQSQTTAVVVTPTHVGGAQQTTAPKTSSETEASKMPIKLSRNGVLLSVDKSTLFKVLGIVKVANDALAIIDAVQDKVPKVGWYAEVEVQLLQGTFSFEWQMKEYTDHRTYLWMKTGIDVVLFAAAIEIGVGVSGCSFKAQIFAKVECNLTLSLSVERINPGAAVSVQVPLKSTWQLTVGARFEAGNYVKAQGVFESALEFEGNFELHMEKGASIAGSMKWTGLKGKVVASVGKGGSMGQYTSEQTFADERDLGSFKWPDKPYTPPFASRSSIKAILLDKITEGFNVRVFTPSGSAFIPDTQWSNEDIAEKLTAKIDSRKDIRRDGKSIEGLAHDIRQRLDVLAARDWSRDWIDDKTFEAFVKNDLEKMMTASYVDPCKKLIDGYK
jgi:hypothetical protein